MTDGMISPLDEHLETAITVLSYADVRDITRLR
jgi:hypothetical protein